MEVNRLNFKETLPQISASIKKADFLVIDTEFTGLVSGRDVSVFDSPKEYYKCLLNGSTEFIVIQYGLCAFYWDEERKHYMNDAFNFFLFPRAKHGPEKFFLCQSSSLDFLIAQGFDFNKMIRDGISYMTEPVETRLREQLTERHKFTKEKEKEIILIPEEHKPYILETSQKVRQFLDEGKEDVMTIDRCNSFVRLLLYQELKLLFKDEILLNTEILENKNRVLKVLRVKSDKDETNLAKQRKEKEWEDFEDSVGFSKVARMISQSGKLIIGHNMLLDIIHTLNNFFQPLPDDYYSFKEYAHFVFPSLLDTKYMSSLPPFKDKVNSSVLQCLMATFSEAPFSIPKVGSYEGKGYKTAQEKHHEAGYDAYITGLCFLSMHEHLSRMRGEENARFSATSPLLKPFLNKLFLAKTAHQDSPYMNLTGADPAPSRDHVFYMTFPKEWTRNDINLMFSPFGPITCYFIDETHAIIALMRRDQARIVTRGVASCPRVSLVPYEAYREKSYLKVDHKAPPPESNCNKIKRAMAITNSPEVKTFSGSVPNVAGSNFIQVPEKVPRVRTNSGVVISPPCVGANSTTATGATPVRVRTSSATVTPPAAVQARKRTSSGVFQVDKVEPPAKKSEHSRADSHGAKPKTKPKPKATIARWAVEQSGSGDDSEIIKLFDGKSKTNCVSAFKESASWD